MTEPRGPESEPAAIDPDLMARRYGTRSRRSPLLLLTIVLVGGLFVGWVVWAGVQQGHQDVHWTTVGYSDVTDTSVTVDFDVVKPANVSVTCLVRALDLANTEVGRAEVPVTTPDPSTHIVYTLRVTARPTTAEVFDCQKDQ